MSEFVKTPAKERVAYRLSRPYWDGRMRHEADSIVYFAEGEAPSTAVKVAPDAVPPVAEEELDD